MSCVGDRGLWLSGIGRPFSDLPNRAVVSPGSGYGSKADAYTEGRDASASTQSDQSAAVASHLSNENAPFRKLSMRQSGRDPNSRSVSGI